LSVGSVSHRRKRLDFLFLGIHYRQAVCEKLVAFPIFTRLARCIDRDRRLLSMSYLCYFWSEKDCLIAIIMKAPLAMPSGLSQSLGPSRFKHYIIQLFSSYDKATTVSPRR
jgi:hypothetical protein